MSRVEKKSTHRAPRYWPVHLALSLLRLMRHWPLPLLRVLGRALGHGLWYLAAERRRIVETNLTLCFPDWTLAQRRQVARECFALTGAAMLDLAPLWFGERKHWQDSVRIEGLERIATLQAQGRGVIILGFHFNDLELGGIALSAHVQRLAAMYRPHANPVFEHAMRSGRQRALQLIDRDDVRAMMKWLKSGGAIWYAADQDYGRAHSVFAPFFRLETATITALSRFAKMGNAVVLPLLHRKDGNATVLEIGAPLPIPGASDTDDARCVNQVLEQHLRLYPANYMWTHRRFKTRPEGAPEIYPAKTRDQKSLSPRRLEQYLRSGTVMDWPHTGQKALQLSAQHVVVVLTRPWYRSNKTCIRLWQEQLSNLRAQQIPVADMIKVQTCAQRHTDVVHLHVPEGKPLANADSAYTQSMLDELRAKHAANAVLNEATGPAHFWLCNSGQLVYLG